MKLSTNWFSHGSKISGCASILGSWQICHNVCTSLVAALATFGIALQGMPLLFLNTWQWPLWIAALVLFGVLLMIRVGMKMRCITTRGVFGNAGLLLAGVPFSGDWVGGARLAGLWVVLFVLAWYLQEQIVRKVETGWVIDFVEQGRKVAGGVVGVVAVAFLFTVSHPERSEGSLANASRPFGRDSSASPQNDKGGSRMQFTLFDVAHAKELMDKNGDGQCDVCGMAIDQCIESGMMQCTMDPNAKIGLLGSQHIHSQLSVLRDGQNVDLSQFEHTMNPQGGGTGSSFIHVEEPDFGRLHMHATGVPLKMFFDSVGLSTDDAAVHVNGQKSAHRLDYVFNDNDSIEVTLIK